MTLKYILFLFTVIMPRQMVLCQEKAYTILQGIVTILDSEKSAYPAQILAYGLATDSKVNRNGTFSLIFPSKLPGQEVRIGIKKVGYEVVDTTKLVIRLPYDPYVATVTKIVIAPVGYVKRKSDNIYNSFVKKYRGGKISDSVNIIAREVALRFASTENNAMSSSMQKAKTFYLQGRLDDALNSIDEEADFRQITASRQAIKRAREDIKTSGQVIHDQSIKLNSSVEEVFLKARLVYVKGNIRKAENLLLKLYSHDSTSETILIDIARFYEQAQNMSKAIRFYEKALSLDLPVSVRFKLLNELAVVCYEKALYKFKSYIYSSKQLLENKDSANFWPYDIANFCNILGNYYAALGNKGDSVKFYYDLGLRKIELQSTMGSNYVFMKGILLCNFGIELSEENDTISAIKYFDSALAVAEPIEATTLGKFLIATVFHSKAQFYVRHKNYDYAKALDEKVLTLYKGLYSPSKRQFAKEYYRILVDISNTELLRQEYETAESHLYESLMVITGLYKNDQSSFLLYYLEGTFKCCVLPLKFKSKETVDSTCRICLSLLKQTDHMADNDSAIMVVKVLTEIAEINKSKFPLDSIKEIYLEAIREVAYLNTQKKINEYTFLKARLTNNLGLVEWQLGDYMAADTNFRNSINLYSRTSLPDNIRYPYLAGVYNNMGLLYSTDSSRLSFACQFLQTAHSFYNRYRESLNFSNLTNFAQTKVNIATICRSDGAEVSSTLLEGAHAIYDSLYKINSTQVVLKFLNCCSELARLYNTKNNTGKAMHYFKECIDIAQSNPFILDDMYPLGIIEAAADYFRLQKEKEGAKKGYRLVLSGLQSGGVKESEEVKDAIIRVRNKLEKL